MSWISGGACGLWNKQLSCNIRQAKSIWTIFIFRSPVLPHVYISLLSLDTQLQVTLATASSRRNALIVAQDRANEGYTSLLELTQAQFEYESAQQMVPELEQAIRQQENAIRLLTGAAPGMCPVGGNSKI